MKQMTLLNSIPRIGALLTCLPFIIPAFAVADSGTGSPERSQYVCTHGQGKKIQRGLDISPVELDLTNRNRRLVGLGSYIVNAQGGCNDCHTNPSYKPGGDPFQGEPEQINTDAYLAGGRAFGPGLVSPNITPCENGKPHGLSFDEFENLLRTGKDEGRILQVMPWPVYGKMRQCDLRAVYEYLSAIPAYTANGCDPAAQPAP